MEKFFHQNNLFMKKNHSPSHLPVASFICLNGLLSCNKQINTTVQPFAADKVISQGAPTAGTLNVNVNATGVCDYTFNEAVVTAAGFSKIFEDNFKC